jgi:hypothetical protein
MKLLTAIMTCHALDYYVDELTQDYATQKGWRTMDQQARVNTIRETWLKSLGDVNDPEFAVDYKFFYGSRLRRTDVKPNQRPGTEKPAPALREPLADEVFLPCGDNYTQNPDKMKAICRYTLAHGYHYMARLDDDTFIYPDRLFVKDRALWEGKDYVGSSKESFHPGGCLILSSAAMKLIVDAPIRGYADDVWIGKVMEDNGIPLTRLGTMHNRYGDGYLVVPRNLPVDTLSSFHSCKPQAMRELYGMRFRHPVAVSQYAKERDAQVHADNSDVMSQLAGEDVPVSGVANQ